MNNNQYGWVDFYKEFAQKLLAYKNNREELIKIVENIYTNADIKMPCMEKGNKLIDIDPFTVFGIFNKSSMKPDNRIKLVTVIKKLFSIKSKIPASFESVPVLNNLNATFYCYMGERGENDIDELWELFESALKYTSICSIENKELVSKCYDAAINKKGNGSSKLTMALYWISPDTFLNLDSRNLWYIYDSGKLPRELVNTLPKIIGTKIQAKDYFDIVEKIHAYLNDNDEDLKDFKDLSYEAWRYSEQVNREKKGTALADEDVRRVHYWMYSPGDGACKWDEFYKKGIMGIGWHEIGDLNQYDSKDKIKTAMKNKINPSKSYKNDALATWQFVRELQPGDIIFAKSGRQQLVGRGIVSSDYYYDEFDNEYPNLRNVQWTHNEIKEVPDMLVMKTLTDITPYTDYVEKINKLFDVDDNDTETKYPQYTDKDFLKQVYMDEQSYKKLVALVRTQKNVILQGAPGVGKTFVAKRLAFSIIGKKDPTKVKMVQFHQSYTYEDFIEGYRPTGNSFEIKKGAFYNFCKDAEKDTENDYFFLIDEINRGNLSKIFGELLMLVENDKRGEELHLLYSNELFKVPKNVYIIGMMNTADRSLALIDYALRRRFAFYEMEPGYNTDGFKSYCSVIKSKKFNKLISCVEDLNKAIERDEALGKGFCIGHSYFCNIGEISDDVLMGKIEYSILPLLKEYWFDEPDKVEKWANLLKDVIK